MVAGFFGFLGSIVGAIATAIAGSVAAIIVVVLFKSGTMGEAWTTLQMFISGAWGALASFWDFLKSLNNAT